MGGGGRGVRRGWVGAAGGNTRSGESKKKGWGGGGGGGMNGVAMGSKLDGMLSDWFEKVIG